MHNVVDKTSGRLCVMFLAGTTKEQAKQVLESAGCILEDYLDRSCTATASCASGQEDVTIQALKPHALVRTAGRESLYKLYKH